MTYQVQLNKTIRRVNDLITLHASKINTSDAVKARVAAIGPIDPKQVTADTIAALEVVAALLAQIEKEWIDENGKWRQIRWYNLLFNGTDRKLVGRTIEALTDATNKIVEIYTNNIPG